MKTAIDSWPYEWDAKKNTLLKETRGICFEDIVFALNNGAWSVDAPHPNQAKYPNQRVMIVEINKYAFAVPYVVDTARKIRYLKTVFPSRKLTKTHLSSSHERKTH